MKTLKTILLTLSLFTFSWQANAAKIEEKENVCPNAQPRLSEGEIFYEEYLQHMAEENLKTPEKGAEEIEYLLSPKIKNLIINSL